MRISWRQRLDQQAWLWDFNQWPMIPLDIIQTQNRKGFLRNQQILAQVLAGDALHKVARRHQLTPGRISQLLDRCLGGDDEQSPALTTALIPYRPVVTKQRASPFPTLRTLRGHACAFRKLLDKVPNLRDEFDAMILAKLNDAPYAQRLAPAPFHGLFKRLLAEANWPKDRYPYTSKSLAYASVRRYLHQRTAELLLEKQQRRQPPPRDLGVRPKAFRAQRATQIDEHVLDLKGRVQLVLNQEHYPLRTARASVLTAVDVGSTCVLGFTLAPTRHPNQQDLLGLFDECLTPWQPLELTTPGLSYAPGACFPSGLEHAFPISFGRVQLDNALMHQALSVVDFLCEQCGATINFGPPGMPTIRRVVESIFDYINRHGSHRFASTTGSYPTDPKKESRKNQKKPPIISWQTVLETLSVLLTEYNITPQAALGNVSPLELFQHQCASHYVRYVPSMISQQWQPLIGEKVVPLHWYRHEKRLPFVNFYYGKYKGPGLLNIASTEKSIRVQFNRKNINTIQAFTLDGKDLGELQVAPPWQRYPHSLATRIWIHNNATKYRFNMRDPLTDVFRYLHKHKDLPESALTLLRVYTEFTADSPGGLFLDSQQDKTTLPPLSRKGSQYVWTPDQANHR